jgi:pilus assembly protein FimV
VGTKLELAKAYLEIGDKDGAREILQEVAKEGSPSQKEEAEKLISSL